MRDIWEKLESEAEEYATETLSGEEGSFDYQENFERICESYITMKSSEMMQRGELYD